MLCIKSCLCVCVCKYVCFLFCINILVEQCKRKWKNLRDAYRAEVRRYLRRLQSDELMVGYEPDVANHKCKWIHFQSLNFLNESKQLNDYAIDFETHNSNSSDHNPMYDTYNSCSLPDQEFHNVTDIKLEPSHYVEINQNFNDGDDDDAANDLLFQEFENIATSQAATKLSEKFSINNSSEKKPALNAAIRSVVGKAPSKCKCSESNQKQIHFLQDLGREEQKLMKSTRQDITRCNQLDHIGDFDYNFLVSFLPQMKKMSELQNLQFRAKMSETVLSILTDPTTTDTPKPPDTNQPQMSLTQQNTSLSESL